MKYIVLVFYFFGLTSAWTQPIPSNTPSVRGWMSGNWFNAGQSGHGLQIEVLNNGRAVLAWYTYDSDGTGRGNSRR